jgi:hypothetical protein
MRPTAYRRNARGLRDPAVCGMTLPQHVAAQLVAQRQTCRIGTGDAGSGADREGRCVACTTVSA